MRCYLENLPRCLIASKQFPSHEGFLDMAYSLNGLGFFEARLFAKKKLNFRELSPDYI